jgi:hypothetical protein
MPDQTISTLTGPERDAYCRALWALIRDWDGADPRGVTEDNSFRYHQARARSFSLLQWQPGEEMLGAVV